MSQQSARVLVVDDDMELLDAISRWLTHSGYDVETATNGYDAISLARGEAFDVVITDLRMPELDGLKLLAVLNELSPGSKVIFLSGQATIEDAIAALREGRSFDFLQKPLSELRALNLAIERALESGRRIEGMDTAQPKSTTKTELDEPLSKREVEVLSLLATGLENREIAAHLALAERTIRNYLYRIYQKLGVGNRMLAVMRGIEHGIIQPPKVQEPPVR